MKIINSPSRKGYLNLVPWKLMFFKWGAWCTLIGGRQAPWSGYHQTFLEIEGMEKFITLHYKVLLQY